MKKTVFLVLVILLAACSTEKIKRDFTGTWQNLNEKGTLFVNEEMVFSLRKAGEKPVNLGKAELSLGEIEIISSGDFCNEITGEYYYEIYKDTLKFREKHDKCLQRKNILHHSRFLKETK